MENQKSEPTIPYMIQRFKNRKLRQKQEEIEQLKLAIEKAKLEKELEEIKWREKEDGSFNN